MVPCASVNPSSLVIAVDDYRKESTKECEVDEMGRKKEDESMSPDLIKECQ